MIKAPAKLTLRRAFPRPTIEQVRAFAGVPTGVVCDAMGGSGALDRGIRPVVDERCIIVGPALVADNGLADILATLASLHIVRPGDVVVAATGAHQGCAAAGDLVMGMMRNAGAAGFVTDGLMRDYDGIAEVGLPAWCSGLSPNSPGSDGPGRVGEGAVVGGRLIQSGDLIVADRNGVVVVPLAEIDEVIKNVRQVQEEEAAFEAKVAKGFCAPVDVEAMLEERSAVLID